MTTRNFSNLKREKILMKSSTICWFVKTYFKNMLFSTICFFCQWCCISICFVRTWKTKFLTKTTTFWLSQRITIANRKKLFWKLNWNINWRNQIIFLFVSHYVRYSISQIENVTICCRLNDQLKISLSMLKT